MNPCWCITPASIPITKIQFSPAFSEPPYTACPDFSFHREDPYPERSGVVLRQSSAFHVRGPPRQSCWRGGLLDYQLCFYVIIYFFKILKLFLSNQLGCFSEKHKSIYQLYSFKFLIVLKKCI